MSIAMIDDDDDGGGGGGGSGCARCLDGPVDDGDGLWTGRYVMKLDVDESSVKPVR